MLARIMKSLQSRGVLGLGLMLLVGLPIFWFWPWRGLVVEFFDNMAETGEPVATLSDGVFDLDAARAQRPDFPYTNFSARWRGAIRIDRDGEYTFATDSDDASFLFIDGVMLVDNGGLHASRKRSASMFLTKGLHAFQVSYGQGTAVAELNVYWTPPGREETHLPRSVLYPKAFPFRGIGLITRHLALLYAIAWGFFILILIARMLEHSHTHQHSFKAMAQNLALSVVTVVIMLVALEGGLRLVFALRETRQDPQTLLQASQQADFAKNSRTYSLKGMVQPSDFPGIVYELKPNLRGIFLDVPVATNSQGLRDVEYQTHKPENTFRIVGLGDSSMFGWGVRMEESILEVLETTLNQASSTIRYEVLNFAVPGYNTAIEADVFLNKCLKYAPDLVVMHFNTNDYDIPSFMKFPENYATLRKSYLIDFVYTRYQTFRGMRDTDVIPFVFDRTMGMEDSASLEQEPNFPEQYRYMVGESGFITAMRRLLDKTTAMGIPVVVYVVKSYPGLEADHTPNEFRARQLQLVTGLSAELGFHLLNMYPAYMNYLESHPDADKRMFWVSANDSHPSAIAHRVEAEALYRFFVENGLVPIQANSR